MFPYNLCIFKVFKTKTKRMYRQGDVLIEAVESIPAREEIEQTLLVRGEGRNHGHFISGSNTQVYKALDGEVTENGGLITQYLNLEEGGVIEHKLIDSQIWSEEHGPITLPPGKYRVIKQREYNPYAKAIRAVRD
jgi:hypothetical protein